MQEHPSAHFARKRHIIDRSFSFFKALETSDRLALKTALLVFLVSLWMFAIAQNNAYLVDVP